MTHPRPPLNVYSCIALMALPQGLAAAVVSGSALFVHSYHALNPKRAYNLALQQLQTSPALAEVCTQGGRG